MTPNTLALAVLLGGAFGGGLLLMLVARPRWRAASLTTRVSPYLGQVVTDQLGTIPNAPVMPVTAHSLIQKVRRWLSGLLGDDEELVLRLGQAGLEPDATRFRGRQLIAASIGFAVGAAVVLMLTLAGRLAVPALLLPVLGAVGAIALIDMRLGAKGRARLARLHDELPTTLEFLGLCLAAGEGLLDSLRRVASVGSGELTAEFARVVLATGTGSSLADALRELANRLQSPPVTRLVDHLISAIERGAPLVGVLQAQAADAREESKRELIEQAGKKEILMMLPLVFLILPLSVVFAVFPALFVFQLG
jgi:tight adherence protein C